jgi:hypothetical protein
MPHDHLVAGQMGIVLSNSKRFAIMMPADAPDEQTAQNHVTFLQNFADEVGRRAGSPK